MRRTEILPPAEETTPPRRFKIRVPKPGSDHGETVYRHGVYFPATDVCVVETGYKGVGQPEGVEWIDTETVASP